ncbi:LysR family transcriptional regulator [Roseococcus sp. YIM B11640]|uniref:LysR family transcriptional regulator n=1 Tax=Roseococcus sp. YIM B11640 TaxID=3133973 RepID=UPI003C7D40B4
MLDPVLLRSFQAVAELRGFSAAAQQLGLRQSTVSGHVRRLEEACGRRLFLRDTHRVRLTPDGEAMLGFARSVLDTEARARRHFTSGKLRGKLRFGASEDVLLQGLPEILRDFTRENPRVDLELTVGQSGALHALLAEGALDLVFAKRPEGDARGRGVWKEPLVWIARPGFAPDPAEPLPLILLAPPSITRLRVLEAMEREGRAWRLVCSSSTQTGVDAAALAGLGVAPHAASLVPAGLEILSGPGLPSLGEVEFVVTGARRGPALALSALIEASGDRLRRPSA